MIIWEHDPTVSDLSPIDSPETFAGWHMPWPAFDVDWTRAALVLVDLQNYGCNPDVGLMQMLSARQPEIARYYVPRVTETAVPNARRLLEGFTMGADETLADVLARANAVAAETEAVVRAIPDLGQAVPVPRGVPWYPDDLDAWSVRWVLMHVVAETARHAGRADIVREAIDGATAFPLMAAAEGWPSTPWLQSWDPS